MSSSFTAQLKWLHCSAHQKLTICNNFIESSINKREGNDPWKTSECGGCEWVRKYYYEVDKQIWDTFGPAPFFLSLDTHHMSVKWVDLTQPRVGENHHKFPSWLCHKNSLTTLTIFFLTSLFPFFSHSRTMLFQWNSIYWMMNRVESSRR